MSEERHKKLLSDLWHVRLFDNVKNERARLSLVETFARDVRNETLEEAAKLIEKRTQHLSKDPHYNGGIENTVRGILECRADDIRALAASDKVTQQTRGNE